jgi:hypothetical protein
VEAATIGGPLVLRTTVDLAETTTNTHIDRATTERISVHGAAAEVVRVKLSAAASLVMSREAQHPRIDLVPGLVEAGGTVVVRRLHVAAIVRALEARTVSTGTYLEQV